jgi:hypothetical protein
MPLIEDTWQQLKLRKAIGKTLVVMYSAVLLLSMQPQRRVHASSHARVDTYNVHENNSDLVFSYGVGGRLVALEDLERNVPSQPSQRRQSKAPYSVLVNVKVLADSPLGASLLADTVAQVCANTIVCVPFLFVMHVWHAQHMHVETLTRRGDTHEVSSSHATWLLICVSVHEYYKYIMYVCVHVSEVVLYAYCSFPYYLSMYMHHVFMCVLTPPVCFQAIKAGSLTLNMNNMGMRGNVALIGAVSGAPSFPLTAQNIFALQQTCCNHVTHSHAYSMYAQAALLAHPFFVCSCNCMVQLQGAAAAMSLQLCPCLSSRVCQMRHFG